MTDTALKDHITHLVNLAASLVGSNPFSAIVGTGFVLVLVFVLLSYVLAGIGLVEKPRVQLTPVKGPPRAHWLFGNTRQIIESSDVAAIYDVWSAEYGHVFRVPTFGGKSRIVLGDPKAISHFYMNETTTYGQQKLAKVFLAKFFGQTLLSAYGDDHKRQRKALTPAFSIAAIRKYTGVFYDSAYKAKHAWDTTIESSSTDTALIDVEMWMNCIALDSIGIAGFSHDFNSLSGESNAIADAFDSLGSRNSGILSTLIFLLSAWVPALQSIPTKRNRSLRNMRSAISKLSDDLLVRTRAEGGAVTSKTLAAEKSIIGLLVKAENEKSELRMTQEEVMGQMNLLILAGYETTSVSLTWALIELSRKPDIQTKLREELLTFGAADPTYDQLANSLPYLDAVVHETLRLHAPVPESVRIATRDDIIPLSRPITTTTGEQVISLVIPKGTIVSAPNSFINKSEEFWGPDAKQFRPERWLDDESSLRKNEVGGHRHILTFSDGPRTCLGKAFALSEFKSVLSVLIRNYEFGFVGGKEPTIGRHIGILARPKIEGEEGPKVPLLVKRVE